MKKIISGSILLLILNGCATDNAYNAGKIAYNAGKQVVIANEDKLSDDTLNKLKSIDEKATIYDESRTIVRDAVEMSKKEEVAK